MSDLFQAAKQDLKDRHLPELFDHLQTNGWMEQREEGSLFHPIPQEGLHEIKEKILSVLEGLIAPEDFDDSVKAVVVNSEEDKALGSAVYPFAALGHTINLMLNELDKNPTFVVDLPENKGDALTPQAALKAMEDDDALVWISSFRSC
ncbi:hypothetical protein IPG41_04010 [Candidatus Peregrinibacteria bacterium]|nr:MAG: hypothetical protein IPG41_04010 [Candidatus Peregrinibacteria bacterium]